MGKKGIVRQTPRESSGTFHRWCIHQQGLYEKLPTHLKVVIDETRKAMIADQMTMNVNINSQSLKNLVVKDDVQLRDTPDVWRNRGNRDNAAVV
jgi:TRAP-type mannitol/chloroaromatic compound transport system substrate-binding protein